MRSKYLKFISFEDIIYFLSSFLFKKNNFITIRQITTNEHGKVSKKKYIVSSFNYYIIQQLDKILVFYKQNKKT